MKSYTANLTNDSERNITLSCAILFEFPAAVALQVLSSLLGQATAAAAARPRQFGPTRAAIEYQHKTLCSAK